MQVLAVSQPRFGGATLALTRVNSTLASLGTLEALFNDDTSSTMQPGVPNDPSQLTCSGAVSRRLEVRPKQLGVLLRDARKRQVRLANSCGRPPTPVTAARLAQLGPLTVTRCTPTFSDVAGFAADPTVVTRWPLARVGTFEPATAAVCGTIPVAVPPSSCCRGNRAGPWQSWFVRRRSVRSCPRGSRLAATRHDSSVCLPCSARRSAAARPL